MRVIIAGADTLIGEAVHKLLARESSAEFLLLSDSHVSNISPDRESILISEYISGKDIRPACLEFKPNFVVNCVNINDVEYCEKNKQYAWDLNVKFTENMIKTAKISESKLIQISSEWIYDGKKGPYSENDTASPLSQYGRTVLAAENLCKSSTADYAVLRVTDVYGISHYDKTDFVSKIIAKYEKNSKAEYADDEFSNPIQSDQVALAVMYIMDRNKSGFYNLGGSDWISKLQAAHIIADVFGYDKELALSRIESTENQKLMLKKGGLVSLKAETDLRLKAESFNSGLVSLKYVKETLNDYNIR